MKSVLITFDQAHYENVIAVLDRMNCRGFTAFNGVMGRGSLTGEPHYGSHAWPSMCSSVITVIEDEKVDHLLEMLQNLDKAKPQLGLRAFVWCIEKMI